MLTSYHLAMILGVLLGCLLLQDMVAARVYTTVHRRPNATHFTPAQTHSPGHKVHNNFTRPNQIPAQTYQPGYPINNFTRVALSPNWSAPAPVPSGWASQGSHTHNTPPSLPTSGVWAINNTIPSGWIQPSGQAGNPTFGPGKFNATYYPAYNHTTFAAPAGRPAPGANPYANLSI
nr:pH-response regulator protein palI/RIM9-like [Drosophila bipectinata]